MIPVFLGITVLLAFVTAVLVIRNWPRSEPMTADERAEMASAPMPALQKGAFVSLLIGLVTLAVITWILTTRGVAEYWDNDDLRLTVVGIFLVGLAAQPLVLGLSNVGWGRHSPPDERDGAIMKGASVAQAPVMILTLAAWDVSLGQMFHAEGAVPIVYLYLMFGCVLFVSSLGLSIGVLVGYWMGAGRAEG